MSRPRVTPRQRRAVHEAGHAVAVHVLGGQLLAASVKPRRGGSAGHVRWRAGSLTPMCEAIVAVAGVLAEQRTYTGVHRRAAAAEHLMLGAKVDLERLADLAERHELDVADVWRWGGVLVDRFGDDIERLAVALLEAKVLKGERIRAAIVGWDQ